MKRHVFVIGDLIVDHDVFVRARTTSSSDSPGTESHLDIIRRQDTAGGAANSARILAILNEGKTYLWGVVGKCHWGNFRTILEGSHAIDGAPTYVELRGVQDESDPPIDTVSRLLLADGTELHRWYDAGNTHVPHEKRATSILYHLEHIKKEKGLEAIIINDFEKKCLDPALITKIGDFAETHHIPLFVDPKFDRERHAGLQHATAVLPNLEEWCHLVDSKWASKQWRDNLQDEHTLREMARLSFHYLGQFQYYIIKCDKDGAVLIFPHWQKKHYHAILLIPPAPSKKRFTHQVGSGDIMTAVFAAEFDPGEGGPGTFDAALKAFLKANAAVACYWEMDWHRMPRLSAVNQKQKRVLRTLPKPKAVVFNGMRLLPKVSTVRMGDFSTAIPGFYSQDETFRNTINDFIKDVLDAEFWEGGHTFRHVILGAPSGTGKTTTKDLIIRSCAAHRINPVEVQGLRALQADRRREEYYDKQMLDLPSNCEKLLFIVDEARKEADLPKLSIWAPKPLEAAKKRGIRFLLLSAEFTREEQANPAGTELFRRCRSYFYSGLLERPSDIPYYFAAHVFDALPLVSSLKVQAEVLLGIIELTLKNSNPDRLKDLAGRIAETASNRQKRADDLLVLTSGDMDDPPESSSHSGGALGNYAFFR